MAGDSFVFVAADAEAVVRNDVAIVGAALYSARAVGRKRYFHVSLAVAGINVVGACGRYGDGAVAVLHRRVAVDLAEIHIFGMRSNVHRSLWPR